MLAIASALFILVSRLLPPALWCLAGMAIGDRLGWRWPALCAWILPALLAVLPWRRIFRTAGPAGRAAVALGMNRPRKNGFAGQPLFLVAGGNAKAAADLVRLAADPLPDGAAAGFHWHASPGLALLLADNPPDDAWAELGGHLAAFRRFGGVVLVLAAPDLLGAQEADARHFGRRLRARLDELGRALGAVVPVRIAINRIDALYGMRSLIPMVSEDRLTKPLGRVFEKTGETPGRFAARTIAECAAELADNIRPDPTPAAVQAPGELLRLGPPLGWICAEAFPVVGAAGAPELRGIFMGASCVRGPVLSPDLERFRSFRPQFEPTAAGPAWFFAEFLETLLPAAAREKAVKIRRRPAVRPGLAALLAGTLLLGWGLTLSFREAKAILASAGNAIAPVETTDELRERRDAILALSRANRERIAPRLGLDAPDRLESQARRLFCEAYERLIGDPELAALARLAEVSAKGGAEGACDALALLADWRDLRRKEALAPDAGHDESSPLLASYLLWDEDGGHLQRLRNGIVDMERSILSGLAPDALAAGLADWVDGRPDLKPLQTATAWEPVFVAPPQAKNRIVRAAWTGDGYRRAREFLARCGDFPPESDGARGRGSVLAAYRREALLAWQSVASAIWRGCRERIADADLPILLDRIAAGEDPTSRMLRLLRDNLRPMREDGELPENWSWLGRIPDDDDPDAADWARFRRLLADTARAVGDGDCVELVARHFDREGGDGTADPLGALGELAERLSDLVTAGNPRPPGNALSPLGAYDYLRYLAARKAAILLDRRWREEIAGPARVAAVSARPDDIPEKLGRFLATAARGLWRIEDGRIDNASRDRLAFMFSEEFLDYCETALARTDGDRPAPRDIAFRVDAVSVNPGARELPQEAEFRWNCDGETAIVYRNFPAAGRFAWTPDKEARLTLRLIFPSGEATATISGAMEIGRLFRNLEAGPATLHPFQFEQGGVFLARLGIGAVLLRARADNHRGMDAPRSTAAPAVPKSIITPSAAPATYTTTMARANVGQTPATPRRVMSAMETKWTVPANIR